MRVGVLCSLGLSALVAAAVPLGAQRDSAAEGANRSAPNAKVTLASSVRHPGRILGVFDDETGAPIAAAEVIDLFTGGDAHTEKHGLVELSQFQQRNDSAAVRIRKIGYADTSLIVMVGPADTVPVPINLHRAAIDLPALISHATETASTLDSRRLAEFEFRRKMGMGYYVDGAELRDHADNRVFGDYLISRFPRLSLLTARDGTEYLAQSGTHCPVSIYVDGAVVYKPGMSSSVEEFRNYKSEDFVAVEWYSGAATVPTEYGGTGATCGVLLLWRRTH
ncbi:MAG TPA: hypothetical protein VGM67_07465 [Gemmatimonadaceae bacterium]|jgi:hypothetical protein